MLKFACPSCGVQLQMADELAGKQVRCGSCQQVVTAPASSATAITTEAPPPADVPRSQRPTVPPEDDDRDERRRGPRRDAGDGGSTAAATGAGIGIGVILAIVAGVGMCLVVPCLIALLVPAVQKVREAAARTQTMNNMKQMALAVHNFNDTYQTLPTPKASMPPAELSWRVSILPYIEQNALYNQFDKTAAWDSPRNQSSSNMVVPIYVDVIREPQGLPGTTTHFQYFTGPGTLWPDNSPKRLPNDFPAGTSNTFLLSEAANPVPWAKPADMVVQPGQPLPVPPDHFIVAFADGSVRLIERGRNADAVLLQHLDPRNPNAPPPLE